MGLGILGVELQRLLKLLNGLLSSFRLPPMHKRDSSGIDIIRIGSQGLLELSNALVDSAQADHSVAQIGNDNG